MAFEEVLNDHSAKYVDQNAFDRRMSHPLLSSWLEVESLVRALDGANANNQDLIASLERSTKECSEN